MQDKAFSQNGRVFQPAQHGNEVPTLPPGYYVVKFSPQSGYYFEQQDPVSMPSRVYGDTSTRAMRVLNSYLSREGRNTGVLLTGNKGSGKTLLSKDICTRAVGELQMAVILIEDAFCGTDFISFLNSVNQRAIIFIDEFEKKYSNEDAQNTLLSLLDGTGVGNKLFLLTSNSEAVSEFLLSRPSRLFYHWRYGKLPVEVLEGYCEDVLVDKSHMANIRTMYDMSTDLSFDVLQSIVEELNRYPMDTFVDVLLNLNVSMGNIVHRQYRAQTLQVGDDIFEGFGSDMVNVLGMMMENGPVPAHFRIGKLDVQKMLWKAFMTETVYFNENREDEDEDAYFDDDFRTNFKFDPNTDTLDGDDIIQRRFIGDMPVIVTMSVAKPMQVRDYYGSLFK